MPRSRPIHLELEAIIAEAFQSAGIPAPRAESAAQIASAALCNQLHGDRVTFNRAARNHYRDLAIYDQSHAVQDIAAAEGLTPRQVRRIIHQQHKGRKKNGT